MRTKTLLLLSLLALMALAGAPARAAEAPAEPRLRWSGYTQFQFLRDAGEGNNLFEEEIRRARLKLDAVVSPDASTTFQIELRRGNLELADAYVDLRAARTLTFRAGQFIVPFAYIMLESPSRFLTPERPLATTRLFPSERDRGAVATLGLGRVGSAPLALQLGSFQGAGWNLRENNNDKDFLASLSLAGTRLSARASYYTGLFTNAPVGAAPAQRVAKNRWGIDAQYTAGPWRFEGLWDRGEGDFPTATVAVPGDVEGWYALAGYHVPRTALTPYVRLQQYDPNTDVAGTTINGLQFGAVYDASQWVRYMLAWERLDDDARPGDRDTLTARAQVRF